VSDSTRLHRERGRVRQPLPQSQSCLRDRSYCPLGDERCSLNMGREQPSPPAVSSAMTSHLMGRCRGDDGKVVTDRHQL
jgi:hypothetical protein